MITGYAERLAVRASLRSSVAAPTSSLMRVARMMPLGLTLMYARDREREAPLMKGVLRG